MKMKKRLTVIIVFFAMLIGIIPMTVLADTPAQNGVITEANAIVTKPVGGEHPSFNAVASESDKYWVEVDKWYLMEGLAYPALGVEDSFETHKRYTLRVMFHTKPGYTFSKECVYTINGEKTGCYGLNADEFRYTYWYAADPSSPNYTVSFDADGGSGTMESVQAFDEYVLPSCTFTAPKGKYFYGWYVDGYVKQAGDEVTVLKNTTVEATWRNIPQGGYTLTFDANGGTGTINSLSGVYGEYTLPECTFAPPPGMQFSCWFLNGDGVCRAPGSKININCDSVVAAVWKEASDNVIRSAAIAVAEPVAGEKSPSGTFLQAEKFSVSIGWSTTADGSDFNDFNDKAFVAGNTYYADLYFISEDPYTFAEGASITVNGNSYTAVWTIGASYKKYVSVYDVPFYVPEERYTVSFNANGGGGSMADVTGRFGDYMLPACDFTAPEGKKFKCWADGSENGTQYYAGYGCTIDSDVTFYAVWEDDNSHTHTPSGWRSHQGYHYKVCTTCGDFLEQGDHEGAVATCYEKGKCTVCGYAYLETNENHDPDTSKWTACGNLYHAHICKDCGAHCDTEDHVEGPAGTPDAEVVCRDCGYVMVPAKGHTHDLTKVDEVDATCVKPGNVEHYVCSGCSDYFADGEGGEIIPDIVIAPKGHKPSDAWRCDENNHWRICAECNEALSETQLAHELENGKCTVCGYSKKTPDNLPENPDDTTGKSGEDGKESKLLWILIPIIILVVAVGIIIATVTVKKRSSK